MKLSGANKGTISGGQFEVVANLRFLGNDPETENQVAITIPTPLLEADIDEEVILGLEWLGERHFDVHAREHGLMGHVGQREIWLPGCEKDPKVSDFFPHKSVHAISVAPVKRALDLFCGRKSAGRVLEKNGYQVVSLDLDPRRCPTICCDILEWDFRNAYPPEYFDIIAASPPCTEYSMAMNRRPRNLELADEIVKCTLEVIKYFAPRLWWIETPRTGMLARRDFMMGFPFLDVDYCQFENLGYQKPTRFFGSPHLGELAPVLCDGQTCQGVVEGDPLNPKKRRRHKEGLGGNVGWVRKEVAYHIPEKLIMYVAGIAPSEAIAQPKSPSTGNMDGTDPPPSFESRTRKNEFYDNNAYGRRNLQVTNSGQNKEKNWIWTPPLEAMAHGIMFSVV